MSSVPEARVIVVDRGRLPTAELRSSLADRALELVTATATRLVAAVDEAPVAAVLIDFGEGDERLVASLRDARRSRAPVIVAADPEQLDVVTLALRAGADDFVLHPIDTESLVLRLAARLGAGPRSANYTPVSLQAVGEGLGSAAPSSYCGSCASVVATRDTACGSCGSAPPAEGWLPLSDSDDPYLGSVIAGRYRLLGRLGHGCHAAVYRAVDLLLGRAYALKITPVAGETTRQAVEREATALASVRNPHIVALYELHVLDDDTVVAVTELVEGHTLASLVARGGPVAPTVALDIARQAAEGLHEVHELGMVHRDIKPTNIMVERLPAGGRFVRVVDFGVVRLRSDAADPEGIYGTPRYAAPEQLVAGRPVDRRADIYALGLVLGFMLTGVQPDGEGIDEIASHRLLSKGGDVARYADRLPGLTRIAPLIESMTAPDPADRPADMGVVTREIAQVSAGLPETNGSAAD